MSVATERLEQIHLTCCARWTGRDEVLTWSADVSWPDRDIMVCRNALPWIGGMISPAEAHGEWVPCTVTDGVSEYADPTQRSSDKLRITGPDLTTHPEIAAYGAMLHATEGLFIQHYVRQNRHSKTTMTSGYEMLRYRPGQGFGEHVDVIQNTVLAARRLSVVAFCNDDFKGGDLVFPRQGLRIRPEAGMLVLFPSGVAFPHEAEPVTRGTRYAIVAWYY